MQLKSLDTNTFTMFPYKWIVCMMHSVKSFEETLKQNINTKNNVILPVRHKTNILREIMLCEKTTEEYLLLWIYYCAITLSNFYYLLKKKHKEASRHSSYLWNFE